MQSRPFTEQVPHPGRKLSFGTFQFEVLSPGDTDLRFDERNAIPCLFGASFLHERKPMLRRFGVAASLVGILALILSLQVGHTQTVGSRPLITQGVDERNLFALRGNTRPEATPDNDRGRVDDDLPMTHMLLQLRRPPEQETALEQFL